MDELDTDYHPALEPSEHDGAWEDDIPNEDQQMGSGIHGQDARSLLSPLKIQSHHQVSLSSYFVLL
jgi:WD repeat-containing protein 23